jgi:translation initiation factor IF-2
LLIRTVDTGPFPLSILDSITIPLACPENEAFKSKIDKGKGPVSTILISNGKLKRGDYFGNPNPITNHPHRASNAGKKVDEALPSMPVEILGMNSSVFAGAEFLVTKTEEEAKEMLEYKKNNFSKNNFLAKDKTTLFDGVKEKDELNIIIFKKYY